MILGHRHPRVVEAVLRKLGHGMSYARTDRHRSHVG